MDADVEGEEDEIHPLKKNMSGGRSRFSRPAQGRTTESRF